jgi:TPP-dependent pyruvate/acetoin dehydrogenase alpha subunit
VEKWEKLDPIPRYQKYLVQRGVLNKKLIDEIEADVTAAVAAGVQRYEAARDVNPLDCFDFLYAEPAPELLAQREEFRAALQREGIGKGH